MGSEMNHQSNGGQYLWIYLYRLGASIPFSKYHLSVLLHQLLYDAATLQAVIILSANDVLLHVIPRQGC